MARKNPYDVLQSRYVTEKTSTLAQLQYATSNRCLKKCQTPKVVFLVDEKATKQEIANAVETIYAEKNVKVSAVNTIRVKSKPRRVRGCLGKTAKFKKAIVSLEPGDSIDEQV